MECGGVRGDRTAVDQVGEEDLGDDRGQPEVCGDLGDGHGPLAQSEGHGVFGAEVDVGLDARGHDQGEQIESGGRPGAAVADGVRADQPAGRVVEQGPVLRGRHPHSPEVKGAPADCRSGVIRYGRTLLTSIAIS